MAGQNIDRTTFLKQFFSLAKQTFKQPAGEANFALLPPGVLNARHYVQHCNECYQCVSVCPHYALRVCHDDRSPFFGKPIIVPRETPCYLCDDRYCVQSCPTPALEKSRATRLSGVAKIDAKRCLAFEGLFCQSCVNACPLSGKALLFNEHNQPVVQAQHCTGCGICEFSCPA